MAELDLPAAQCGRRKRRAQGLRQGRQGRVRLEQGLRTHMSSINYSDKIPNNVGLSDDRTLQRALEQWQPNFINWWDDVGP
ncbi:MAG TPA: benzoyl-CoA 2,3-epoxidase subunit BoxB, partial [Rubrivivax sp.]|nr:benzoyl-CoA 2,3-epoxidase subunit BoxB [Rubrivivax sp.]